jgi:choline dehydrogenase-like flavoprotein
MIDERYDYVVIGSGFGGSITACRLAHAAHSVCVLERGRRWPQTGLPRTPAQVASEAFWDMNARRLGLIAYSVFDRMHVIHGSSVGGGSLHTSTVPPRSWRPLPGVGDFVDLEAPGELTNEIARVAGLGPSPQPATELTRQ